LESRRRPTAPLLLPLFPTFLGFHTHSFVHSLVPFPSFVLTTLSPVKKPSSVVLVSLRARDRERTRTALMLHHHKVGAPARASSRPGAAGRRPVRASAAPEVSTVSVWLVAPHWRIGRARVHHQLRGTLLQLQPPPSTRSSLSFSSLTLSRPLHHTNQSQGASSSAGACKKCGAAVPEGG
jgi:hypothetical protein